MSCTRQVFVGGRLYPHPGHKRRAMEAVGLPIMAPISRTLGHLTAPIARHSRPPTTAKGTLTLLPSFSSRQQKTQP